jgi:hypothetical protein
MVSLALVRFSWKSVAQASCSGRVAGKSTPGRVIRQAKEIWASCWENYSASKLLGERVGWENYSASKLLGERVTTNHWANRWIDASYTEPPSDKALRESLLGELFGKKLLDQKFTRPPSDK